MGAAGTIAGVTSPLHQLPLKKANKRRTLVRRPDYINYPDSSHCVAFPLWQQNVSQNALRCMRPFANTECQVNAVERIIDLRIGLGADTSVSVVNI